MSIDSHFAAAVLGLLENPDTARTVAAVLRPYLADDRRGIASPWMTAGEAAAYLRCVGRNGEVSVGRVRKLTSTGDLPVHRDGRRVLYHRDDLDAFIRRGGAVSP